MRSTTSAAWEAATLLRSVTSVGGWSYSARYGSGTHIGVLRDGPGDWDMLGFVYSSWEDLALLAGLPCLLAAEAVRHGVPPASLPAALQSCTADRHARAVARLEAATPGQWRIAGSATVAGDGDGLDVSGTFTISNCAGRVKIAELSANNVADLAAVHLVVEGLELLRELAQADPATSS